MNKWIFFTLALASLCGARPAQLPGDALANRLGLPALQREAELDVTLPICSVLDDGAGEQAFRDCTDILR